MSRIEKYVVYYDKMTTGSKTFDKAEDAANFANSRMQDGTFKTIRHVVQDSVSLPTLLSRISKRRVA